MRTGFALILLITLALLGYVAWRVWHLLPLPIWGRWLAVLVILLLTALAVTSVMGVWDTMPLWMGSAAYNIGNTWLIVFFYLALFFLVVDVVTFIPGIPRAWLGGSWRATALLALSIAGLLLYGNLNYNRKERRTIELTTDKPKLAHEKKLVLVSDLHLGYHNRQDELTKWVEMINAENPDLVLIAGDIIDGRIRPLDEENDAEAMRAIKAPVVACLGNHEYITGLDKSLDFLNRAGITVLRDSVMTVDGLSIIGRDDLSNRDRKELKTLMGDVPAGNYTILLDHQPANLPAAEKAGVDFQFSGHTHRGQIWPMSLFTDWLYECSHGEYQRGMTRYYVSSGMGLWGGKYRIGTASEYVVATLHSSDKSAEKGQ